VTAEEKEAAPIYIVSGGAGTSGEQLLHTVLVQFPEREVPVTTVAHVRRVEQIEDVVKQAATTGGSIVHTLVDTRLYHALQRMSQEHNVVTIDAMSDLLSHLSEVLDQEPLRQPGLYRKLHQDYFERVAAIEFSMAHDDGKNPQGWSQAEIVLVGLSRVGKTPLSMYLAVQGWKVVNVPLIMDITPPPELFRVDPGRVVGMKLEPRQILAHRQQRQRRLGTLGPSPYADPLKIYDEVEAADRIFKQGGFSVLDVTNKPIEASADDVIRLITRQVQGKDKRSTLSA
jgi:regulator of PEP synthase PpsR (kinase-PPPase family)